VSNRVFRNDDDGCTVLQPITANVLNEVSVTRGSAEFMVLFELYVNDVTWRLSKAMEFWFLRRRDQLHITCRVAGQLLTLKHKSCVSLRFAHTHCHLGPWYYLCQQGSRSFCRRRRGPMPGWPLTARLESRWKGQSSWSSSNHNSVFLSFSGRNKTQTPLGHRNWTNCLNGINKSCKSR